MSSSPPPAVAARKAPGPPAESPSAIAVRVAASAALVAGYFAVYDWLVRLFGGALQPLMGTDSAPPMARALAVTLLGVLLVAVWWKVVKSDPRFHAPILITYILAIGNASYGILDNHSSAWLKEATGGLVSGYSPTFVAIIATVLLEMVLARFSYGKWPHLASAYISGISVGILIKSPELWPYVLCGLISIASKYVLRVRGRHLWNPSNFGVTMLLFLAPQYVASLSVQVGNGIWPVLLVWALGGLILYRLGRLHIPLVFLAAFVPLAFVRHLWTHNAFVTELGPITWPMFQLYIFFMITDPKTTTRARWSQCVVVVVVAAVDAALRLAFEDVHALYHALFIVAPISNLMEIVWDARKAAAKQREATARQQEAAVPAAEPAAAAPSGGARV
jgi:hypothetical protein